MLPRIRMLNEPEKDRVAQARQLGASGHELSDGIQMLDARLYDGTLTAHLEEHLDERAGLVVAVAAKPLVEDIEDRQQLALRIAGAFARLALDNLGGPQLRALRQQGQHQITSVGHAPPSHPPGPSADFTAAVPRRGGDDGNGSDNAAHRVDRAVSPAQPQI